MSEYGHAAIPKEKPPFVPGCDVSAKAKAARKRLLEEVERRRRISYQRFFEKRSQLRELEKDV